MSDIIKALEAKQNEKIPAVKAGDSVSVHVKIKEGERERIQEFKGTIIRTRKGGTTNRLLFGAWLPTVLELSALFCSAHRVSIRLWSSVTASFAGRSFIL